MTEEERRAFLIDARLKYCGRQGAIVVTEKGWRPFWVQEKYGSVVDINDPLEKMTESEWRRRCTSNPKIPWESLDLMEELSTDELPGGSTPSQYALPEGAKELQDLIEFREMNYALGNIFKACYRLGHCSHSDTMRDLRKIKWFVERLIKQEERNGA